MRSGLLAVFLFAVLLPLSSTAGKSNDIRIVIDVSGSMVNTDPHNLRRPALRMLTGLLPADSYAGVWMFGRYSNMEVKWGKVDERWRKLAEAGADKIHSRGQFTNIESALERASIGWDKPDDSSHRNIILLTDGKVDISRDQVRNAESRDRLLAKTLPKLVANGVRVHAIALSSQSDEALLKRLAVASGGAFTIADSADHLQRIFLHMFERAANPDTVPLVGNRFTIDQSVREMTLLVFRQTNKPVALKEPNGKRHEQSDHGDNVRWRQDAGYDLITVTRPSAGEWVLDAVTDPDNRVMIVTDLKLEVVDLPTYLAPNQDILLQVELHNEGKKISKNSFLKFVEFSVNHEFADQQQSHPLQLKPSREIEDKGIYQQRIASPLAEGSHDIVVSADARTFSRNKRFTIDVEWPVGVETEPLERPGLYKLVIEPRPEFIDPDSLRVEVTVKPPGDQRVPLPLLIEQHNWVGTIDASGQPGPHIIEIQVQATSVDGEKIEYRHEDISVSGMDSVARPQGENNRTTMLSEAEAHAVAEIVDDSAARTDEGSDLLITLVVVGVVNLVLVLVAAGAYWYLRRQRLKDEFNLMSEEEGIAT